MDGLERLRMGSDRLGRVRTDLGGLGQTRAGSDRLGRVWTDSCGLGRPSGVFGQARACSDRLGRARTPSGGLGQTPAGSYRLGRARTDSGGLVQTRAGSDRLGRPRPTHDLPFADRAARVGRRHCRRALLGVPRLPAALRGAANGQRVDTSGVAVAVAVVLGAAPIARRPHVEGAFTPATLTTVPCEDINTLSSTHNIHILQWYFCVEYGYFGGHFYDASFTQQTSSHNHWRCCCLAVEV